jgi:hypothetical protein
MAAAVDGGGMSDMLRREIRLMRCRRLNCDRHGRHADLVDLLR